MSDAFSIQNCLKQGEVSSPLFFNFSLEYSIRKVQENQEEFELNGTHQSLVFADCINILNENIITNMNTQSVLQANGDIGIEASTEKN
jgi:hypothetical protein